MFKVHEEAIVNIIDSNITKTKLEKGPISENIKKKLMVNIETENIKTSELITW